MSKAEQLIACLEGEIAKRDEELAACRVAVENCEVFRARIVELEDLALILQCKAIESDDLRSELAAIKAQEPVAAQHRFRHPQKTMPDWSVWQQTPIRPNAPAWTIDGAGYEVEYRPLYAAPVSEAKAQGSMLQKIGKRLAELLDEDQFAEVEQMLARLNAAPGQQVGVPDGLAAEIERAAKFVEAVRECERLASSCCGTLDGVEEHGGDDHEDPTCAIWHRLYYAMFDGDKVIAELRQLAASPAAPAAAAGHVFYGMDGNHP